MSVLRGIRKSPVSNSWACYPIAKWCTDLGRAVSLDKRGRNPRHLDGESISSLCREFGISRVTGHKIIDRYKECGVEAFTDRSRRPYRIANQLPFQVESLIVQLNVDRQFQ